MAYLCTCIAPSLLAGLSFASNYKLNIAWLCRFGEITLNASVNVRCGKRHSTTTHTHTHLALHLFVHTTLSLSPSLSLWRRFSSLVATAATVARRMAFLCGQLFSTTLSLAMVVSFTPPRVPLHLQRSARALLYALCCEREHAPGARLALNRARASPLSHDVVHMGS